MFFLSMLLPYRLYYKIFNRAYGAVTGNKMFLDLEERLSDINTKYNETCAVMKKTEDQVVIAICTPLMKRVHTKLKHSGEMVFIDSSGNCDRHNSRIFLVMTHSAAGGLPLGVFITSSESQQTIEAGLRLLHSILPEGAFYSRKHLGPKVAITDDCLALRQSITALYPNTCIILCIFHLLQAMWRWLWDSQNGVAKNDRASLLNITKSLVYAQSPEELDELYERYLNEAIVCKYPKFKEHFSSVYSRKNEWAICLRDSLPVRGNHTNNFSEAAMRIVKDKILFRMKAFNVTQLVDFMITRFESYYERRLIDVSNNRMVSLVNSKYFLRDHEVNTEEIEKVCDIDQK